MHAWWHASRLCFRDTDVVKEEGSWMVAKASRHLDEGCNTRIVVESHAKSTSVARYYAARFNEQLRSITGCKRQTIFFVPCHLYHMAESEMSDSNESRFFTAERFLPGAFLKYNSNNGYVCDDSIRHNEAVQAFTHFSFVASGGQLLVADLQGVAREAEALLTDPQVLSLDASFGPGDLGAHGMKACLTAHRCGPMCRRLGLEPLRAKVLQKLCPAGSTAPIPGRRRASRSSTLSSGWERPEDAGSDSWEKVSERSLCKLSMTEGTQSSQVSSSSWVHPDT